ncbi:hypothetical protein MKW92_029000 [Papaver armeniacum]|nr:hypothetical protein MKW92_029000 [Papaver armeniacum]
MSTIDEMYMGAILLARGIKSILSGVVQLSEVTDLKDMPKRELRVASKHILSLFQDNYPEMVALKQLSSPSKVVIKLTLEIEGIEGGATTITWDLVVGGWNVDYIQKVKRITESDTEPIHNSYTAKEARRMVLSVDNSSSRKKKVAAYRYFVRKPMFLNLINQIKLVV